MRWPPSRARPSSPTSPLPVAYDDRALPIDAGQTISQPYIVARMTELLGVEPGDRILEIGTGSGYQAAILARLGARVTSIERHADLAEQARDRLATLGIEGVEVRVADGSNGEPEGAPWDGIIVTAAAPAVPDALREQLAVGARLVIPVGPRYQQDLIVVERRGPNDWDESVRRQRSSSCRSSARAGSRRDNRDSILAIRRLCFLDMSAARLIRTARRSAGLSQRDLAVRAEVPQSTVGRIETRRLIPRVDTVERLLRAAGQTLATEPQIGIGIDRTLIQDLRRLTPDQRLRTAAAHAAAMTRFEASRR